MGTLLSAKPRKVRTHILQLYARLHFEVGTHFRQLILRYLK